MPRHIKLVGTRGEDNMSSTLAKRLIRHESTSPAAELSDEILLERFLTGERLESQEAFQALVVRHGPMVLGICRHVLNQDHDAEDAFQATFLVLARKGGSIRNRKVLSGWLHEVAYRIAVKSRASTVRRRTLERQGIAMLPPAVEPNNQDEKAGWNELRPVLHEEVNRLPEKYRIPVILSYMEGKTNEEVAELLQWPVGTVKGRLSRARDLLRSRLTRRGLALSAAFLVTALSQGRVFAEVVPAELVKKTVRLAITLSPRSAPPDPSSSSREPARASTVRTRVDSETGDGRMYPRLVRFGLPLMLFLVFSASLTLGTCLAVLTGGGSFSDIRSGIRAAVSMIIPARAGGPCH
jgi:RNA polymerase sigma factor (sigma-70 family)